VCEYAGEVLTEAEGDAPERRAADGHDAYRFSLDHFEIMEAEEAAAGEPELPAERALCVDARMVAGAYTRHLLSSI
jgi:hypothetical protein